jgi:hypothetical protein
MAIRKIQFTTLQLRQPGWLGSLMKPKTNLPKSEFILGSRLGALRGQLALLNWLRATAIPATRQTKGGDRFNPVHRSLCFNAVGYSNEVYRGKIVSE